MKNNSEIVYQLLNYERNRELLDRVPHVSYLDLAIVFSWAEASGRRRKLITEEEMVQMEISLERMEQEATQNTPRICPVYFHPLEEVIRMLGAQMNLDIPGEPPGLPMYLLSNVQKFLGASAMIYPGMLQSIAEEWGDNFYILPSSIHECILVPEGAGCSGRLLEEMVAEVNQAQVPEPEVLSYTVYYYDRRDDSIHF